MELQKSLSGDTMTAAVIGRVDSTNAAKLEAGLVSESGYSHLVLDLTKLEYISSAGLRVLLALQKKANQQKGTLVLRGVSRDVMEIFDVTGFSDILTIETALRQMSIDGLERIAGGMTGDVYRVDEDTILKLYKAGMDLNAVENEKKYAKQAFISGIPTAISFDLVAVGDRRGVLYELVNAKSYAQLMVQEPGRTKELMKSFAEMCKLVHSTKGDPKVFPDIKEAYMGYVDQCAYCLTPEEMETAKHFIRSLPDSDCCIHGDLHPGNIMLQDGEPVFIDMGDFCIGNPLFDLCQTYSVMYRSCDRGICKKALGMEVPHSLEAWGYFEEFYFGATTEAERTKVRKSLDDYTDLRALYYLTWLNRGDEASIRHVRDWLKRLP